MRCYLINLDRSQQRLQRFLDKASHLDFQIVRLPAVDGRALSQTEIARWSDCQWGPHSLMPEEIGCFLSHRAAWQAVAKHTEVWSFVAEDDIHFGNSANDFVSRSDWVPPDADIIKAETFRQSRHFAAKAARSFDNHAIRRMHCQHSGAAGYFLSRTAASRLVHLTQNICALADSILFEPKLGIASQFNIYQIDPALCVQDQNMPKDLCEGIVTTLREAIPRHPKPTGFSKLKREIQRPFIAIMPEEPLFSNLARHVYSSCTGSVFKSIPYSDD